MDCKKCGKQIDNPHWEQIGQCRNCCILEEKFPDELNSYYVDVPVHKTRTFRVEAENEDLAAKIVLDYLTLESQNEYGLVQKEKVNPAIKDHEESDDVWSGDGDSWTVREV